MPDQTAPAKKAIGMTKSCRSVYRTRNATRYRAIKGGVRRTAADDTIEYTHRILRMGTEGVHFSVRSTLTKSSASSMRPVHKGRETAITRRRAFRSEVRNASRLVCNSAITGEAS